MGDKSSKDRGRGEVLVDWVGAHLRKRDYISDGGITLLLYPQERSAGGLRSSCRYIIWAKGRAVSGWTIGPLIRACVVTSHDGDNPSKWRYESAPWKGATAESIKNTNFFFLLIFLAISNSCSLWFLSRGAQPQPRRVSALFEDSTNCHVQVRFTEYPRADGTISFVELFCNDGVLSAN